MGAIQPFDVYTDHHLIRVIEDTVSRRTQQLEADNIELKRKMEIIARENIDLIERNNKREEESTAYNKELRQKFDSMMRTMECANARLAELSEQLLVCQGQIKGLTRENSQMNSVITEQAQLIGQLQSDLKVAQETLEDKNKQIAALQESFEKCNMERQILNDSNLRSIYQQGKLNEELDALRKEKAEAENQMRATQAKLDRLKRELKQTKGCCAELQQTRQKEAKHFEFVLFEKNRTIVDQMLKSRYLQQNLTSAKDALTQEQGRHAQTQREHQQTKASLEAEKQSLVQEKASHDQTKLEREQTKQEYDQTLHEAAVIKTELVETQQLLSEEQAIHHRLEEQLKKLMETHVPKEQLAAANQKTDQLMQLAQSRQEEFKKLMDDLVKIKPNSPNDIQQWAANCATMFAFNEGERSQLASNLAHLLGQRSSSIWQWLLGGGVIATTATTIPLIALLLFRR